MTKIESMQRFFSDVFQSKSKTPLGKFLESALFVVIFLNVLFATIETVDGIFDRFSLFFLWFEFVSIAIFSVEYGMRIWVAKLKKNYSGKNGRMRFVLSTPMLIDLTVILVFVLQLFVGFQTKWILILRVFRIFRILRLIGYSPSIDRILVVLKREKEDLITITGIMITSLMIVSASLYVVEQNVPGSTFTSIPIALWWGVETLTTTGFGDMIPITPLGKLLGSIASIIGVGIVALPTGLLGASFYQEVSARRERKITKMQLEIDTMKTHVEKSGKKRDQVLSNQLEKIDALELELKAAQTKIDEYETVIRQFEIQKSVEDASRTTEPPAMS